MTDKEQFKPGDTIEFCDEHYTVIANYGNSGRVKDAAGYEISPFYWMYDGEFCKLVRIAAEIDGNMEPK